MKMNLKDRIKRFPSGNEFDYTAYKRELEDSQNLPLTKYFEKNKTDYDLVLNVIEQYKQTGKRVTNINTYRELASLVDTMYKDMNSNEFANQILELIAKVQVNNFLLKKNAK